MKNLSYLMYYILYQICNIILNIYYKNQGEKTVNHSIKYIQAKEKIESRLKLKQGIILNF